MIIDTSAIIAILRDEAGASDCARAIEKTRSRRISAANFVETALVIDGSRDPIASRRFDEFFKEANISGILRRKRPGAAAIVTESEAKA